jgi:hypothetical protein
LEAPVKYLDASEIVIPQGTVRSNWGVRLHECAGNPIVKKELVGIKRNTRRVARANLDDPPRVSVADHTVLEDGVRIRVHGVFEKIAQIAGLLRVERHPIRDRLVGSHWAT